jgi:GT2 family glycosyltransferase
MDMQQAVPECSVIIATRNRPRQLERMLASLEHQTPKNVCFEVIIVHNGSDEEARSSVGRDTFSRFAIITLIEEKAGRSQALNRGMEIARGNLVIFADDDITVSPEWIHDLSAASERYRDAAIFCGPITPAFPANTPDWLKTHPSTSAMFGRFAPPGREGPLPNHLFPFGANLAVRRSLLESRKFRTDLGPSQENGALMGEDIAFVQEFRESSLQLIFVPSAGVLHHVEEVRVQLPSLRERAFQLGRADMVRSGRVTYLTRVYGFEKGETDRTPERKYERGGLLNYYCGQLFEVRHLQDHSRLEAELLAALAELECDSYKELLGMSAASIMPPSGS